jgi:hypothetical protein
MLRDWWETATSRLQEQRAAAAGRALAAADDPVCCTASVAELEALQARWGPGGAVAWCRVAWGSRRPLQGCRQRQGSWPAWRARRLAPFG